MSAPVTPTSSAPIYSGQLTVATLVVYSCSLCGSILTDRAAHTAWHQQLAGRGTTAVVS